MTDKNRRQSLKSLGIGALLGLTGGQAYGATGEASGTAILVLLKEWWESAQRFEETYNRHVEKYNEFFQTADSTKNFVERIKSINETLEEQRNQIRDFFDYRSASKKSWTKFRFKRLDLASQAVISEAINWNSRFTKLVAKISSVSGAEKSGKMSVYKKVSKSKFKSMQTGLFVEAIKAEHKDLEKSIKTNPKIKDSSRTEAYIGEALPMMLEVQIRQLQTLNQLTEEIRSLTELMGLKRPIDDSQRPIMEKDFEKATAMAEKGEYDWKPSKV